MAQRVPRLAGLVRLSCRLSRKDGYSSETVIRNLNRRLWRCRVKASFRLTVVGRPASRTARPEGRAGEYRKAGRSGNARRRASRFRRFRPQGHRGTMGATAGGSGAAFMPVEQKRRIFVRDSDSQPQSSSLALPGQGIVSVDGCWSPCVSDCPPGRTGRVLEEHEDWSGVYRRDLKEITECGSGRTTAMEGMDWQNPSARAQNFHNPNGFPKSFYVPQG